MLACHPRPPDFNMPPLSFVAAQVREAVIHCGKGSSVVPGLSGFVLELIWVHEDDQVNQHLTACINAILAGSAPPPDVVLLLNTGDAVAILKDEQGAVWPNVMGHVPIRVAGKLALTKLWGDLRAALSFHIRLQ